MRKMSGLQKVLEIISMDSKSHTMRSSFFGRESVTVLRTPCMVCRCLLIFGPVVLAAVALTWGMPGRCGVPLGPRGVSFAPDWGRTWLLPCLCEGPMSALCLLAGGGATPWLALADFDGVDGVAP